MYYVTPRFAEETKKELLIGSNNDVQTLHRKYETGSTKMRYNSSLNNIPSNSHSCSLHIAPCILTYIYFLQTAKGPWVCSLFLISFQKRNACVRSGWGWDERVLVSHGRNCDLSKLVCTFMLHPYHKPR